MVAPPTGMQQYVRALLRRTFADVVSPARLDLRSLAALRIGLGATLLVDLLVRARDLDAHYGLDGVYGCQPWSAQRLHWDLFPCAESLPWPALHLAAQILLALALLVGLRTRLVTLLSWVALVSLHNRNPIILNGGDSLLRLALFWCIFLPLHERWSVDRWLARSEPKRSSVHSVASWAYVLQILVVYPVVLWHRQSEPAWWDGTALPDILQYDLYATRLGVALRSAEGLLRYSTYATMLVEAVGPLLALLPVFGKGWLRTAVVFTFMGLHIGIGALVEVGTFWLICTTAWLAFLPSGFWDSLPKFAENRPAETLQGRRPAKMRGVVGQGFRRHLPAAGQGFRRHLPAVGQGVVLCLLLFTAGWNLSRHGPTWLRFPEPATTVGKALRLEQRWRLFPDVPRFDGWFVMAGQTAAGDRIDLLRDGAPLSWEKPDHVLDTIPSRRWGKLLQNLRQSSHRRRRTPFLRHYAQSHNRSAPCTQQLVTLQLYFVPEEAGEPGKRPLGWTTATPRPDCAPASGEGEGPPRPMLRSNVPADR